MHACFRYAHFTIAHSQTHVLKPRRYYSMLASAYVELVSTAAVVKDGQGGGARQLVVDASGGIGGVQVLLVL